MWKIENSIGTYINFLDLVLRWFCPLVGEIISGFFLGIFYIIWNPGPCFLLVEGWPVHITNSVWSTKTLDIECKIREIRFTILRKVQFHYVKTIRTNFTSEFTRFWHIFNFIYKKYVHCTSITTEFTYPWWVLRGYVLQASALYQADEHNSWFDARRWVD